MSELKIKVVLGNKVTTRLLPSETLTGFSNKKTSLRVFAATE